MTPPHGVARGDETAASPARDTPVAPIRYEQDSYGWTLQQADLLRTGQRDAVDLPNLAQVLSGLAAQDRSKLKAALEQILQALLKWDHAPELRSRAWSLTLHQQRRRVARQLQRQPGLMAAEPQVTRDAYALAREAVTKDLGFDEKALPALCPYGWIDIVEREIEWIDA